MVSGLGGGLVGFQTLALSALGHRMAPNSRVVGLVSAGLCAACLIFGSTLLTLFPKPVLGGLLLFLGLAFLVEWVYDAWFKLPRVDYFVVIVILLAIAAAGFLESVGLGIAIAVILFVFNYSRIDVVKHTLSGATTRSNVQRPRKSDRALRVHGHELFILQLQGFVFFGTANQLVERLRQRTSEGDLPAVRYLLLDFRLVSAIDSSAVLGFVKMRQLAENQDVGLIFAHTPAEIRSQLEHNGIREGGAVVVRWFEELDLAVEWCEDQILLARGIALQEPFLPLDQRLARIFASDETPELMKYLEKAQVPAGHVLMRQDDPPDDLYLIEAGRVTVEMELADGQTTRLLTLGPGTAVGQEGLYLGARRRDAERGLPVTPAFPGISTSCRTDSADFQQPAAAWRTGWDEIQEAAASWSTGYENFRDLAGRWCTGYSDFREVAGRGCTGHNDFAEMARSCRNARGQPTCDNHPVTPRSRKQAECPRSRPATGSAPKLTPPIRYATGPATRQRFPARPSMVQARRPQIQRRPPTGSGTLQP